MFTKRKLKKKICQTREMFISNNKHYVAEQYKHFETVIGLFYCFKIITLRQLQTHYQRQDP
jgi:hypothetical protein